MTERHIVAMGGRGFAFGRAWRPLDEFITGLTSSDQPRVCFVGTASGDSGGLITKFYEAFPVSKYRPSHLPLFDRPASDLEAFLLEQDVIYVGGGNTVNMLALWRVHGVDRILRKAWERGIVLCGYSAGSVCWFEGGTTNSFGPELAPLRDGLGFLGGSHSPHYDGEAQRRPAYHRFIFEGLLPPGIAADNGVGLHYVGTELNEVVSSHRDTAAYNVQLVRGEVQEERLEPRLLTP